MLTFLIKKFIPDSENVSDASVRTKYAMVASVVGIMCNIFLFAGKLFSGLFMQSIAVVADAFNNLSDAGSSVVTFVGMKMASKPADEDHPFGHGRIEYIAAFIVAFLVIEVGFTFLKSSVQKIMNPEEITFQWIPFIMLLISVLIKLWLGAFNKKLGRKINSKVLEATAADCRGDVAVTSVTMAAILVSHFFHINIDGYAGILVSAVVMWAGINIAKDTLEPLIGQAVDPEVYKMITEKVESYEGIVGTHDLIVHNYGPNRSMASIHAEVPSNVDIGVSHEIIDRIEREVAKEMDIFLVIHMDPLEVRDEELQKVREQLQEVLGGIDGALSFHDFRMVSGEKQTNLIFDIVVPHSYSENKIAEATQQVKEQMNKIDGTYVCVITVDKSFVAK